MSVIESGLIHLYYGQGKGKTTCAFGLALRCAGCGYRVRIAQFLKHGETGEVTAMRQFPNVEILRAKQCGKFTFQMNEQEKKDAKIQHRKLLEQAFSDLDGVKLLVLDEILAACLTEMVDEDRLMELIASKPKQLELVMTGRDPSRRMFDIADYITEMKKHRHPFDKGITARHGIER